MYIVYMVCVYGFLCGGVCVTCMECVSSVYRFVKGFIIEKLQEDGFFTSK